MAVPPATDNTPIPTGRLHTYLDYLRLPYVREHHATLAQEAAEHSWPHVQYLETLIEGEAHFREDRRTQRRVTLARFPILKTLDQFNWSWPKKINRLQVQNLFRLKFIEDKANVIFLGGVGLGKSHLTTALGYAACLQGYSVRFTTAIDAINTLSAAHGSGRLKSEIKKYLKPRVLILDELGYLPIDKNGADLLFQVISGRYERGSLIITSNRAFKKWPEIFNNDGTLTSALLDRLLHHAETLVMKGTQTFFHRQSLLSQAET